MEPEVAGLRLKDWSATESPGAGIANASWGTKSERRRRDFILSKLMGDSEAAEEEVAVFVEVGEELIVVRETSVVGVKEAD